LANTHTSPALTKMLVYTGLSFRWHILFRWSLWALFPQIAKSWGAIRGNQIWWPKHLWVGYRVLASSFKVEEVDDLGTLQKLW